MANRLLNNDHWNLEPRSMTAEFLARGIKNLGSIMVRVYAGDELLHEADVPAEKVQISGDGRIALAEPPIERPVNGAGGECRIEFWAGGDRIEIQGFSPYARAQTGDLVQVDFGRTEGHFVMVPAAYPTPPPA